MFKDKALVYVNVSLVFAVMLSVGLMLSRGAIHELPLQSSLVYQEEKAVVAPTAKVVSHHKVVAAQRIAPASIPQTLPILPPVVTNRVMPVYPEAARLKGIEGATVVRALVGVSGKVEQTEIISSAGLDDLDQAAQKAVSGWTFSPAMQGSASLTCWYEVPVRWQLKD